MNTSQADTDTLLKQLDAAPEEPLSPTDRRRARARMEQILATDPRATIHPVSGARGVSRRRLTVTFPAVAVAAVAGIAAAVTLAPSGDAYASWTAEAEPATAADTALAAKACVEPGENVLLAERRGEWVAIATESSEPAFATCLVHLPVGATSAGEVHRAVGGGQGAVPAAGEFTDGVISETTDAGFLGFGSSLTVAFNVGFVGPDVTDVTITTPNGRHVEATVDDGRFLAWWPGKAFGNRTEGNGGPAPDLTYTLTLDSGDVIEDATPVLPR